MTPAKTAATSPSRARPLWQCISTPLLISLGICGMVRYFSAIKIVFLNMLCITPSDLQFRGPSSCMRDLAWLMLRIDLLDRSSTCMERSCIPNISKS